MEHLNNKLYRSLYQLYPIFCQILLVMDMQVIGVKLMEDADNVYQNLVSVMVMVTAGIERMNNNVKVTI